ncbi:MAG: hypothetical protein FWE70_05430 [Oscillospiraceae bacterium]|nr:hypothetical protein [Oscillospiraceae bacterium]
MGKADPVGMEALPIDRRHEYLGRLYERAHEFYGAREDAVTDAEVAEAMAKLKVRPEPKVRKVISLRDWKFRLDPDGVGLREGYFLHEADDSGWEGVSLPHTFDHVPEDPALFGRTGYMLYANNDDGPHANVWRGEIAGWYRAGFAMDPINPGGGRYFMLNPALDHKVAYLRVNSANLISDVWVNDAPVMYDHWGLFPYEMEVTEALCSGISDRPFVAVRTTNVVSNMPHFFHNGFQHAYFDKAHTWGKDAYDWRDRVGAGLADDVTVTVTHKCHLRDAFIHTESISPGLAHVSFDLTVRNQYGHRFGGKATVTVTRWDGMDGPEVCSAAAHYGAAPMADSKVSVRIAIPGPDLWTPDSPSLYLARIVLHDAAGEPIDDLYESFGVRTFRMEGARFYLNGVRTVLRGTHDICNYFGEPMIAPGDPVIVKDILLHKGMGANCSRWPSDTRLHCRRIAEWCDQLGYMLTWAGYFEVWNVHPQMEMLAARDVGAMVGSLRNRPSIVIWEMADEALLCDNAFRRQAFSDMMYRLVREADPTRPVVPNSMYVNFLMEMVGNPAGKGAGAGTVWAGAVWDHPQYNRPDAPWDIHGASAELVEGAVALQGGGRPLIVTEFGAGGMPDPKNVGDMYDEFRWKKTPFYGVDRSKGDVTLYGRAMGRDDWKVTQAMGCVRLASVIHMLRRYPDEVSAYSFVTMYDYWTILGGLVDMRGNAKLTYHAARRLLADVCVTALRGGVMAAPGEALTVSVSNYGGAIEGACLRYRIRSEAGGAVTPVEVGADRADGVEGVVEGISAKGGVGVTDVAALPTGSFAPGLYSLEMRLLGRGGEPLADAIEMFYVN